MRQEQGGIGGVAFTIPNRSRIPSARADSAGLMSAIQVLEPVRHDVDARRGTQPRLLVLGDLSSDEARTVPQDVVVAIERSRTHQTGRRKYHRWREGEGRTGRQRDHSHLARSGDVEQLAAVPRPHWMVPVVVARDRIDRTGGREGLYERGMDAAERRGVSGCTRPTFHPAKTPPPWASLR